MAYLVSDAYDKVDKSIQVLGADCRPVAVVQRTAGIAGDRARHVTRPLRQCRRRGALRSIPRWGRRATALP